MDILTKIVSRKREEVDARKRKVSESRLSDRPGFSSSVQSFSGFVCDPQLSGVIAEFKRKSPSKPAININAKVANVIPAYTLAGASAISVLTDTDFFGGSDEDLVLARKLTHLPLLRKDFVIDPYQVVEARSLGADVILLIAEILTREEVDHLSRTAGELGMETLLEVHSRDQLFKYHERIRNVGINNRNLSTFVTDTGFSESILPYLPQNVTRISESGIEHPDTVRHLKKLGFDGFLIGESYMKTSDPGMACRDFIQAIKSDMS